MSQLPVACTLTADQMRCDMAQLLPGLHARASAVRWIDNGLRMTFDASSEHLTAILTTVDRERHCCAFLAFDIAVPAGKAPFELTLHGPDGTIEFLKQLGLDGHEHASVLPTL
jgi:hypothetical protein